jgi:hypothetical protein
MIRLAPVGQGLLNRTLPFRAARARLAAARAEETALERG